MTAIKGPSHLSQVRSIDRRTLFSPKQQTLSQTLSQVVVFNNFSGFQLLPRNNSPAKSTASGIDAGRDADCCLKRRTTALHYLEGSTGQRFQADIFPLIKCYLQAARRACTHWVSLRPAAAENYNRDVIMGIMLARLHGSCSARLSA